VELLIEGGSGEAPLFSSPVGGYLYLQNWRHRSFDPAVKAAGLKGVTPHVLRHTAASLAVASGANVKAVQRMLGHASAAMTLDVYSGLFDDDLDAVAERLEVGAQAARADYLRTGTGIIQLRVPASGTESGSDLRKRVVPPGRIELPTHGLGNRCSIP
jgi:hypothetical protein